MSITSGSYLIYLPGILGILFLSLNGFKFVVSSFSFKYLILGFILVIFSGFLHFYELSLVGFSQIILISIPLIPFVVINNFNINIFIISIINIIGFLIINLSNDFSFNFSIQSFYESNNSSLETNQHPFVFGLFVLYFFYKKEYPGFFLNLIFLILSFKRIVILGVLFSLLYFTIIRRFHLNQKFTAFFFPVLNVFVVIFFYLFSNNFFDDFIREITGLSPGHFSMGRQYIYKLLFDTWRLFDFTRFFFGVGQGFSLVLVLNDLGHAPHSDLIVLLIDHGIFVFLGFFFLIYKYRFTFLILYFNFLLFTDNILVYNFFIYSFLLICLFIEKNDIRYVS